MSGKIGTNLRNRTRVSLVVHMSGIGIRRDAACEIWHRLGNIHNNLEFKPISTD